MPRRILVVDDMPDYRATIGRILSVAGYTPHLAANEGEALKAIDEDRFDFAIIDVRLHDGGEEDESGLALAMAFRLRAPGMNMILLTKYVRTWQIVRAVRDYGVIDFVEKTPDIGDHILRALRQIEARGEQRSSYPVEPLDLGQYNLGAIRNLMSAAFTDKDLQRLCHDCPIFRPILASLVPDCSLEDMIDTIVEYCEKRLLFFELLAEIRERNPRQYERYRHQIYGSGKPTPPYAAAP